MNRRILPSWRKHTLAKDNMFLWGLCIFALGLVCVHDPHVMECEVDNFPKITRVFGVVSIVLTILTMFIAVQFRNMRENNDEAPIKICLTILLVPPIISAMCIFWRTPADSTTPIWTFQHGSCMTTQFNALYLLLLTWSLPVYLLICLIPVAIAPICKEHYHNYCTTEPVLHTVEVPDSSRPFSKDPILVFPNAPPSYTASAHV